MKYIQKIGDRYNFPTECPKVFQQVIFFNQLPDEKKAEYGWYPCIEADKPTWDNNTQSVSVSYTLADGVVTQSFVLRDLTEEELFKRKENSVKLIALSITTFLNTAYARRGYENHISARAIKSSSNPVWAQEGVEASDYYDLVWNAFETMKNNVIAGGSVPTIEEFFAQFPVLWDTSA